MSHSSLIAAVEDWLLGKALGDPDIQPLFEKLCDRLRATGIPLDRASLSWPTLHPLFKSEQVFWRHGEGSELNQYMHTDGPTDEWLSSPLYYAHKYALSQLRRRLTGPDALLDFTVLQEFRDSGFTDYVITTTAFGIADVETFAGKATGMIASWMTKREAGFSDNDLDALRRIQRVFAIACRASVQRRVTDNIATAYLGLTAGHQVLRGEIRRGDGKHLPAVVWFSDLRGSTRLSDTMDPDSYLALLNTYFECTAQPVIDHGGEILNFIGDGVLAIFPVEDACPMDAVAQAENAVHAALMARKDMEKRGTPGGAPLQFGIGLDIGDVKFGNIGVPARLAFSAIGKVVNTVQRIEAATKLLETPVLASGSFAEAAKGEWVTAGDFEISDFDRRLEVFTLPKFGQSGEVESTSTPAAAE
ncbi:MAG: adenylate/guanylate cyclase domain-containing protein [Paracoccaceae bacterium]